jgi:hypothetical protein
LCFICEKGKRATTNGKTRPSSPIALTSQMQGCQMVYFQTKNPNLDKFWRALDWKMLKYFMTIWYILCSFGSFFPVLVSCTKTNLATPARYRKPLVHAISRERVFSLHMIATIITLLSGIDPTIVAFIVMTGASVEEPWHCVFPIFINM